MRLILTPPQKLALLEHARSTAPDECCGILTGRREGETLTVVQVHAVANTWDGPRGDRYMLDPLSHLRIQRETRRKGLEIVGFYHSHPTGAAIPSRFDAELAWPEHVYLIISLTQEPASLRAWESCSGSFKEAVVQSSTA